MRKYKREWMAARRAAFFRDKSCEQCGATSPLELDHRDPALKTSHKVWSWSAERRAAEIAKCRILCRDCHSRRHAEEMRKPLEHGTCNAYKAKRCRCEACRAWNAAHMRGLRSRARQAVAA